MSKVCLVTGANGHLGNNLVRELVKQGYRVKAGVRDTTNTTPFKGLDVELVYAEMTDMAAMTKAMEGVDYLFHVAAVFKSWSRHPQQDIVETNIRGTEITLKAASACKVKRVVYVSSIAAIGHKPYPLDETHWNTDLKYPYYRSKQLAEQQAWKIAKQKGIWMVSVLPSTMIGANAYSYTDPMSFLNNIVHNQLPVNPAFQFNYIDVKDVAQTMVNAIEQGKSGERYTLSNSHSLSVDKIVDIAQSFNPSIKRPPKISQRLLTTIGVFSQTLAKLFNRPPKVIPEQVRMWYNVPQEYNTEKAKRELNFKPKLPEKVIADTLKQLIDKTKSSKV